MKRISIKAILVLATVFIGGCFCQSQPDTLTQVSTIDALLAGVYDGQMPIEQLLEYGDTGIGTFDKLDGEMIVAGGVVYQIKADGKVYTPAGDTRTPFAAMVDFQADKTFNICDPVNLEQFEQQISDQAQSVNGFYAIKAHGKFSYMKTRSVPAQQKPYPPLVDVAKKQSVFEMADVSGTIIGFYCPAYVKGINVTGYHLHFISDYLAAGGHILDFTLENAQVEIDICNRFVMLLPQDKTGFEAVDLTTDRSEELQKVEK